MPSTDGTEAWIVYHAMAEPNAGWLGRTARAQKFYWNLDNSPNFGRPRGFAIALESPSTTRTTTTEGSNTDAPNCSTLTTSTPISVIIVSLYVVFRLTI